MKKLIIFLGVVGVSLSAILVRSATAPSMVLVLYRMLFSVAVLIPLTLIRHRAELKVLKKREVLLSLSSGFFLGLHFTVFFSAIRYTTIAAATVLVDTEVFFVALATPFLLGKRVSRQGWFAIALTFLGSILIAAASAGGGSSLLLGDGLALLGAVFVAAYTLIGTEARKTVSTTIYTTLVYSAGAATVGVLLLLTGTPAVGYGAQNLAAGLGLAVFCTLLGHSVFSWGLKYESPAFVSTAKLLEPVFASLLAVLLFREIPGILVVLGGIFVIAGIAWYTKSSP